MHYKVKLKDPQPLSSTPEGYLSYWLDITQPALYTRGEAIKKARAFGGKIEAVPYTETIKGSAIVTISAKLIIPAIRLLMKDKALFVAKDMTSIIYAGDVFLILKKELDELKNNNEFKIKDEIAIQLNELLQVVTADYVLINDMCFS